MKAALKSGKKPDFPRIRFNMTDKKNILLIGRDPALIDFSSSKYSAFPGMDASKVLAGLKASQESLAGLGYEAQLLLIDFGKTAEAAVRSELKNKRYDCIMIGAGVRTAPGNFLLFEKLINVLHEHATQAKICFNTSYSEKRIGIW